MFDIAKHSFDLPKSFLDQYQNKKPQWSGLSYFTFKRTYARAIEGENRSEEWWETCRRVVEGTFSIQKNYCDKNHLPWDERKAQRTAKKMFELMWNFKFLPPGRGLWMMGTDFIVKKGSACLQNCGFVSTKYIDVEPTLWAEFIMDMSMLGVGVGFDTRGIDKITIKKIPQINLDQAYVDELYKLWNINKVLEGTLSLYPFTFKIHDTREGWVASLRILLSAYFRGQPLPEFDYSKIREAGKPIKGFGGTSSGPQPLIDMHNDIKNLLENSVGSPITSTHLVDIGNLIGRCVVAGNVRRSSEIVFGDSEDKEYALLKQDKAKLNAYRWNSNNSIFAKPGMDYSWHAKQTSVNGEPGYCYLDNMRAFGRMKDPANWKDKEVMGGNPCQTADSPILTPEGIRRLGDIGIGNTIWSGTQWTKITDKWSTGIKPVYLYETMAGRFIGTENHRILSDGVKVEICDADSIDTSQGPYNQILDLDPKDIMDGLVCGDGTVHERSVLLHIGQDDQDYFNSEIEHLIVQQYKAAETTYKISTTIEANELPKTYERFVPDRFYYGDSKKVAGFLRGLYSANGSVVSKRVTLKASSLKLVRQIQEMLSSLGIRSYYTTNQAHEVEFANGIYECKESYDLNITTDRKLFLESIGFIQNFKIEKLQNAISSTNLSKYACSRPKTSYDIVSREYLGDLEVFDLTVEAEEHTYWTGGLLVSNCLEQSLCHMELCNLVETFPAKHESLDEYLETLKIAYLYAKTVTLIPTHWPVTNAVMIKNRRIGLSQSGIIRAFGKHGRHTMREWCDKGYEFVQGLDIQYSNWLGIPRSVKTTSVKPSGTVSLLASEPPGIHYPHSEYYIRRIRVAIHSVLWKIAEKAGYKVEPAVGQESTTMVVEFPVKEENFVKGKSDVSIWEQVQNAVFYQKFWADNQVSITVSFNKNEAKDIQHVLELNEDALKGISFLPLDDHGYVQAPYETITKEQYEEMSAKIIPMVYNNVIEIEAPKFCDSESCTL